MAVHSTARGPAMGGCRLWEYETPELAVRDALRLSEGMSYKNAVAGLSCGGGKGVLARPAGATPSARERNAALRDFGDLVASLNGDYLTAEDVGMTERDMAIIAERTPHVTGRSRRAGGSGDPSPATALGVFTAIARCCARVFGTNDLRGRSITVIGLGHVGLPLAQLLAHAGATLTVTDIDPARRAAAERLGARWTTPGRALTTKADVLAPCALGGSLTVAAASTIRARVIAGAANNQLDEPAAAAALQAAGILWAPDFVVNAGGVINIGAELDGPYDPDIARQRVLAIGDTLDAILDDAERRNVTPYAAAMDRARALIAR